jgi:hypothetical protein
MRSDRRGHVLDGRLDSGVRTHPCGHQDRGHAQQGITLEIELMLLRVQLTRQVLMVLRRTWLVAFREGTEWPRMVKRDPVAAAAMDWSAVPLGALMPAAPIWGPCGHRRSEATELWAAVC